MTIVKNILTLVFSLAFLISAFAQEEEGKKAKPVRPMFGSAYLIDNQSVEVYRKKTFEWVIQHRFGPADNGLTDFFGIYGISNIRLGFNYVPIERVSIGYGITQNRMFQDFNLKFAALRQTRSGSIPVSVTYYGSTAIDSRPEEEFEFYANSTDRIAYFHQLIIARKFSSKLSIQVAPSITHYNGVPAIEENGEVVALRENDHLAIAIGGRYKVSSQGSIIVDYNHPLTDHFTNNPKPSFSFGYEVVTSSHAFQVFLGNYWGLIPQENNFNNQNDQFLIGFNITRLWSF